MTAAPTRASKSGVTAAVFAAGLALATPMVAKHEGVWLIAKPDTLAHGIPTVCFGETEGVRVGDRYTERQCEDMLSKKLVRYAKSAAECIYVPVSAKMFSTFIDLNYNIGEAAFCRSSAARLINALDYAGGCEAMRVWTNAGGQFRQGLLNRRLDEIAICREGIKDIGKLEAGPAVAPLPDPIAPDACGGEWVNDQTYTSHPECRKPAPAPVHHPAPKPVALPEPVGFWCRMFCWKP